MLNGEKPSKENVKLTDLDFMLHAEHGSNASSFAARVTIGTKAGLYDAFVTAISTLESGDGESVKMIRNVYNTLKSDGFDLYGPIQGDAAINKEIAQIKGIYYDDRINVMIFPSLDAGNIAYKLCQSLGKFRSIGPFLQGFKKPVCDLSRGSTTEDIISSSVLTIASI